MKVEIHKCDSLNLIYVTGRMKITGLRTHINSYDEAPHNRLSPLFILLRRNVLRELEGKSIKV
jgi:hypothetical protein